MHKFSVDLFVPGRAGHALGATRNVKLLIERLELLYNRRIQVLFRHSAKESRVVASCD